jgi:hypothetical protein
VPGRAHQAVTGDGVVVGFMEVMGPFVRGLRLGLDDSIPVDVGLAVWMKYPQYFIFGYGGLSGHDECDQVVNEREVLPVEPVYGHAAVQALGPNGTAGCLHVAGVGIQSANQEPFVGAQLRCAGSVTAPEVDHQASLYTGGGQDETAMVRAI